MDAETVSQTQDQTPQDQSQEQPQEQTEQPDLESRLEALQAELATAREALDAAERRHTIERELVKAKAVDVEAVALITEAAIAGMERQDVAEAVAELKRAKPFLFRKGPTPPSAMAAAVDEDESALARAAAEARETGDRRALIRYLRLRRGG